MSLGLTHCHVPAKVGRDVAVEAMNALSVSGQRKHKDTLSMAMQPNKAGVSHFCNSNHIFVIQHLLRKEQKTKKQQHSPWFCFPLIGGWHKQTPKYMHKINTVDSEINTVD